MKKLLLIASIIAFSTQICHAADNGKIEAKNKLSNILACNASAKPVEVVSLIKMLGGKGIIQKSPLSDSEYTLPDSVDVFGLPISKISVHPGMNDDGDFNEYGAVFSGESIDYIAKIAGISQNAAGDYRKEIGNNDLTLRAESGITYITCSNDVRTIMKSIKRALKSKPQQQNQ